MKEKEKGDTIESQQEKGRFKNFATNIVKGSIAESDPLEDEDIMKIDRL